MNNKTMQLPRFPKRPANGLLAWQATVGFINLAHGQDVMLTLRALPKGSQIVWQGSIAWDQVTAQVDETESLAVCLRDLWPVLERAYAVFPTALDAVRAPVNYADHEWIDGDTLATLERLIEITQLVFHADWSLVIVYQPVDNPAQRVKMRLIARDSSVTVGGQGPSLREACRDLYRNAAPEYFHSSGRLADGLLE